MSVPNAKRTFAGQIRSVLACSGATRCGHSHNIPVVAGIDRKNFNRNAHTGDVIAALPIASASGNDKLSKRDRVAWRGVSELRLKVPRMAASGRALCLDELPVWPIGGDWTVQANSWLTG